MTVSLLLLVEGVHVLAHRIERGLVDVRHVAAPIPEPAHPLLDLRREVLAAQVVDHVPERRRSVIAPADDRELAPGIAAKVPIGSAAAGTAKVSEQSIVHWTPLPQFSKLPFTKALAPLTRFLIN